MIVGLVACCKTKAPTARRARDLYCSALFKKSVAYLEPRVDGWAVLSALHGVVLPDQVVEPYELTLNTMPARARSAWAAKVSAELRAKWPGARFIVIAGRNYRDGLNVEMDVPFAGLELGELLSALTKG